MNATDPLTVTLQAQQWNIVLGALGEAPWRIADPVIRAIMQQTQEPPAEALSPPAKPNGAGEVEQLPAAA